MTKKSVRSFRVILAWAIAAFPFDAGARSVSRTPANLADNPKFHAQDPRRTVIANIAAWSHPTKAVFERYGLKLTKVELMWNKTFPVFHVAEFGADPGAGPSDRFFDPFERDLLRANGNNAYKVVEDSAHDGFVVVYDRRTHGMDREMVQEERR